MYFHVLNIIFVVVTHIWDYYYQNYFKYIDHCYCYYFYCYFYYSIIIYKWFLSLMLLITFTTDSLDGYEMERWVIIMSDLLEMVIIFLSIFLLLLLTLLIFTVNFLVENWLVNLNGLYVVRVLLLILLLLLLLLLLVYMFLDS